MKKLAIRSFIGILRFIYMFIRPCKMQNKVALISRQSDNVTLDFALLRDELISRGVSVDVLCKKFSAGPSYFVHILKQMKAIATSRMVVIDSYCIPVSVLKHKESLKVMQIWHALAAIKMFGWQTVEKPEGHSELVADAMHMHENYNYIAAPSDVTASYFCKAFGYGKDKIVKLALPRVDYIRHKDSKKNEEVLSAYDIDLEKKNILYVPTFRRTQGVDVRQLAQNIDFDRYNLLVRLHPLDEESTDKPLREGIYYVDKFRTYDYLHIADVVISDYSAFALEASLLDIPLYLFTYDEESYESKNGLNVRYSEEAIGKYAFCDSKELVNELETEYDFEALHRFREKYIEVQPEHCAAKMADFIAERIGQDEQKA